MKIKKYIQSAEIVLPCTELETTLDFYSKTLGLFIEAIFPADNPQVAVLSGYGIRIRLEIGSKDYSTTLRLKCNNPSRINDGETSLLAPNGTTIELVEANPELKLPAEKQSLVLTRLDKNSHWGIGRAGMRYRDLIPNRQGGRFIASHIQIPNGGPVDDYVHFHNVRFQLIYCYKGWVKVVYEDQGEPFILEAGDCVVQPPQIRHRVLESSPGLEVIEIGCPAEHETFADPMMQLPTDKIDPEHNFSGQTFVRHIAKTSSWKPWRINGFECRDSGIGEATNGLAGVHTVRATAAATIEVRSHQEEFLLLFILKGSLSFEAKNFNETLLNAGDSLVIPKGLKHALEAASENLEFLEVRMSDNFKTTIHDKSLNV